MPATVAAMTSALPQEAAMAFGPVAGIMGRMGGLMFGAQVGQALGKLADEVVTLDMTLTSAACPLTDVIEDQAHSALEGLVKDVKINWVWLPPWGPDKITDDGREQLRALGFNV